MGHVKKCYYIAIWSHLERDQSAPLEEPQLLHKGERSEQRKTLVLRDAHLLSAKRGGQVLGLEPSELGDM